MKEEKQEMLFQPLVFLEDILEKPESPTDFFIFSSSLQEQFETAIDYLTSTETVSMKEVTQWKAEGFLVVAQTIDGDYIAGTYTTTLVIPASLYTKDIERYPINLKDFFIDYKNGKLHSFILPKVNN